MNGIFKVNKANLALTRATIKTYGEAWLHGCGNVYATAEDSDFRKNFTNPNPDRTAPPSAYAVHFNDVNQVPATPEQAEEMLIKAKAAENREAQRQKTTSKVRTVSVSADDLHEDDKDDTELAKKVIAPKPVTGRTAVVQTAAQAAQYGNQPLAPEVKTGDAPTATGSTTTASDLNPQDDPNLIAPKGAVKGAKGAAGVTI